MKTEQTESLFYAKHFKHDGNICKWSERIKPSASQNMKIAYWIGIGLSLDGAESGVENHLQISRSLQKKTNTQSNILRDNIKWKR